MIKTWTEVAARVRLYMLTSDLASLVPPQFSHWLQVRKVGTAFFFNPNHYFKCLTLISTVASARNRSDNIRNSRLCKLHKVSKGGLGRWDQTLGNRLRTAKESP